jgi:ubiquitin-like 1-activating enzyme E1 B
MCITADVPLVESGTMGYNGQSSVIKKGVTECYECYPKEEPKSFAVCTIRNTPSQPIHCIVWAKSYLFTQLFGPAGEESSDLDFSLGGSENDATDLKRIQEEMVAFRAVRDAIGTEDFPKLLFDKVFKQDIELLRGMEEIWKTRAPPTPFEFATLSSQQLADGAVTSKKDQKVWSETECFVVFLDSLQRLTNRFAEEKEQDGSTPVLEFDKDDVDTLDFVAAIANLRSYAFGIEARSKFDIKQMAGNIIPAIATTNAIIAGACVLQAFKVFRGDLNNKMFGTSRSIDRLMTADYRPPNPDCHICGQARAQLIVDPARAKVNDLVTILREELQYGEDIFSISALDSLIYENDDEDEDMEDILTKSFAQLGLKGDTVVTVQPDPRVKLLLTIQEEELPEDSAAVKLLEKVQIPDRPKAPEPVAVTTNGSSNGSALTGVRRKRTHSEVAVDEPPTTKRKIAPEVIEIDDNAPINIDSDDD